MEEYGRQLGLCFQLKDDLLDYSDQDIGKPTLADIADGKATLPLIIALHRAPAKESGDIKRLAEQLLNERETIEPATQEEALQTIYSFVMRYDGTGYVTKKMEQHKQKAIEAIGIFHNSPAKSSLLQLLQYSIIRNK